MRAIKIAALAFGVAGVCLPAVAQTLEGAIRLLQAGEIKEAVGDWEALARGGDADALFNLGQVYRLGTVGDADALRAAGYYQRAVELGHTPAMRELGRLYAFDPAFGSERAQGVALLRAAAHVGDPEAEYLMGVILFAGDLVPRDKIRAYAWAQLAAEGGEGQAIPLSLAIKGELSGGETAEALNLSHTMITAPYQAASPALLVGERPVPRRFAGAINEPAQPADKEALVLAEEKTVMGEAAGVEVPPLALPEPEPKPAREALANVVEEAEVISTVTDEEAPKALKAGEPEAREEEPESAPPSQQKNTAETGGIAVEDIAVDEDEAATLSPADEHASEEEGPEAIPSDLGDPDSPLVDAEGFAGAFSIQLASFRTPEKAEAEWQVLSRKAAEFFSGLEKRILRFELGPELGVRYRLRVGPFAYKDAADARCEKLTEAGIDCLVIWP